MRRTPPRRKTLPENMGMPAKTKTEVTPVAKRPPRISPRTGVLILIAAALCWAGVFGWTFYRNRAQRHIEAGIEAVRSFQGARAEKEWREAVRIEPNNPAAWDLLGEYYLSTNNQEVARDAFRELLRLRPQAPDVLSRLSGCCLRTGDEVGALKYALEALKTDPDNVEALTVAVPLLSGLQDQKRRLDYLHRLVRLQPENISALSTLAIALSDNHLYDEVTPILERMLTLDPNNTNAYTLRGEARFQKDASPEGLKAAEADFQKAIKVDPRNALAQLYLGRIAKRRGQPAQAIPWLLEAARLRPDKPEPYFELTGAYEQTKQPALAAAARQKFTAIRQRLGRKSQLEKRVALNPKDFEGNLEVGLLAVEDADYRKASYYLNAARTLRPNDPRTQSAMTKLTDLRQRIVAQGH